MALQNAIEDAGRIVFGKVLGYPIVFAGGAIIATSDGSVPEAGLGLLVFTVGLGFLIWSTE